MQPFDTKFHVAGAGALLVELKTSKTGEGTASAKRGGGPIFVFQAHGKGRPRLLETGADVVLFCVPAEDSAAGWQFCAVPTAAHFSGFNTNVYTRLAHPSGKLRHTRAEVAVLFGEWRSPAQLAPLVRVWAQEKRAHEQRARSRSRSR